MVFVGAPHLPILGHTSTGLLYRTGDLVRRNPAGLIEYLGRRDNEVKISGQRVDLESIERCLLETKLVSTAVALKATELQSSGGSTILVAYVVPSSSRVVQKSIKEAYVQRASHLMVPRLKLVDAIPLTPSGKVDRKQLAREFQEELEQHSIVNEAATTENVEDTMRKLWGQVLGMPAAGISAEEDFFSLGGTSLHAARLISRINRVFDVPLRVAALFESPTLFGMSEEVRKARLGAQYEESLRAQPWMRDSNLGQGLTASIAEAIDWQRESEGRVFLTGATGFVGAFLLKELLSHPQVKKVACLVRAQDENCALLRIRRVLDRYGLSISTEQEALIVPLPGDVVHDHLGLSHGQYQHWANWTSVIFHLAAHVNYLQPYSSHHAVNVLGTLNMLRFSQEGKSKPLHYTSSISAYGPTELVNSTKHIPEDERPQGHQAALEYDTGYAQSQFTAEMIAWNAIDQGLPVTIHRLGVVLGHSSSGTTNLNDFISLLVRTCLRSGVYPSLPGHSEEFVPVDFVVSSMLRISSHRENSGTAYNILHPGTGRMRHLSLFQLIKQQSGRPLIEKPYDEWITTVSQTQDCELSSIMPMLVEKVSDGRSRWQMQANMPTFGIENLHRALSGIPGSLRCPPLGALLEIYIGQWIQQSYVHPN
ncbi:male sterility protein-domain-containing protein [Aspergillus undulatus]|uniref:male sterility protein-domain-containing protein n=1 Tax=Aspergillus undulatus TaxID=1810928 RepID=UPI003CCDE42C